VHDLYFVVANLRLVSIRAMSFVSNEFRFYSDKDGKIKIEDLSRSPEGVGAIPLEPRGSPEQLDIVIASMLKTVK
jgi:hypothetical protein